MKIPSIFAFAALATCTAAFASNNDPASTARQDTKFLEKANQGSVNEVELAQLILKKSSNSDVKEFAQRMVDDHTKLLNDMKPFDDQTGLKVPEHPDASTEATKVKFDLLSGDTLDKAYIKAMVEDHSKDLQAFMAEEKSTANPAFRDAVKHGESTVRDHLKMIDDLAKSKGIAPAPVPGAGF